MFEHREKGRVAEAQGKGRDGPFQRRCQMKSSLAESGPTCGEWDFITSPSVSPLSFHFTGFVSLSGGGAGCSLIRGQLFHSSLGSVNNSAV